MAKAKVKKKNWTDNKAMELERCYLTLQMEVKDMADRFNCSVAEIKRKLKELGIWQGG